MAHNWQYSIGASQWQDFTQYQEYGDTNGSITVAATRIDWDAMTRTASAWVASDFGAGYFTDFVHDFEVMATLLDDTAYPVFWSISQNLDSDAEAWNAGGRISAFYYETGGTCYTYLREYKGGGAANNAYVGSLSFGTPYYTRIVGNSNVASGQVDIFMYTTASRDTIAWHGKINLQATKLSNGYRYFHSYNALTGAGAKSTGYMRNLTMRKIPGVEPEDKTFKELRTNINTARATAGLGAYSWTASITDGVNLLASDILELRTAISEGYDELLTCAAHHTSDDATHYSGDDAAHDSSDDATHYTTNDSTHYTTDDSNQNTSVLSTHYTTHDATKNATYKASYWSSRKTYYDVSVK